MVLFSWNQVFVKKEEMIRHFKWHKKRDESLQHGFMRYSPVDDCSKKFGTCTHNGRQTHYHCLQVMTSLPLCYLGNWPAINMEISENAN